MNFRSRLIIVVFIVLGMFVLHNSFWLWPLDGQVPLLFGFMPFAYSYYVGYAFLAMLAMKLIIYLAWPDPPAGIFEECGDSRDRTGCSAAPGGGELP